MFINGQTVLSACPHKPLGKDSQGVLKYISIIDLFRNFAKCFGVRTDEGQLFDPCSNPRVHTKTFYYSPWPLPYLSRHASHWSDG